MVKKYVVKDFEHQTYYAGENYGFAKEPYWAYYFDSVEDAEKFIGGLDGFYQIELVYSV